MSVGPRSENAEQRLREMNEALLMAAVRQQELAEQAQVAEAALRETEGRYRSALRVGRIGSWEVDFTSGIRLWSPEGMDLFGLDLPGGRGHVGGDRDEWRAALHPDDRELPARVHETLLREDQLQVEYRIVRPDGRMVWLSGHAEVVGRDDRGRVTRLLNVAADVTETRLATEALRESEARFRTLFESIDEGFCVVEVLFDALERPVDYRFLEANPAFERHTGLANAAGGRARDLMPNLEEHWFDIFGAVAMTGRSRRFENVAATLGRVFDVHASRVGEPHQRRVAIVFNDITARKEAEAAVRASRRRLRALVEGIPQLVWRAGSGGEWTWSSPQWSAFTGLSEEASRGRGWLDALHPEDRETAEDAWGQSDAAVELAVEYRIFGVADRRHRWFQNRAMPVQDEGGAVVEWLGTSTDVDELRGLQDHQRLLLAELQHRVRNTLSVVRSIARRTAQTAGTVEDYAMHLDGRLSAFARTQAAVTRDPAAGVSLDYLIAEELVAYAAHETRDGKGGQVRIAGPEIRLMPKAAEMLGLAIHELATNAVKYGALSPSVTGRVAVRWRILDGGAPPLLHLTWIETVPAGTVPSSPRRLGFGTELLERTLKFELKAHTTLEFTPTGLRCTIDLPLTGRVLWSNQGVVGA